MKHEQSEFAAELSVIAFLRFFEANEIIFEFLLRFEGDTIHSLHLLALLIAAPVGSGYSRQTETIGVDLTGLLRHAGHGTDP